MDEGIQTILQNYLPVNNFQFDALLVKTRLAFLAFLFCIIQMSWIKTRHWNHPNWCFSLKDFWWVNVRSNIWSKNIDIQLQKIFIRRSKHKKKMKQTHIYTRHIYFSKLLKWSVQDNHAHLFMLTIWIGFLQKIYTQRFPRQERRKKENI